MAEFRKCCICGGSFFGTGTACPWCEIALSREPLEIRSVERKMQKNYVDEADRSHDASSLTLQIELDEEVAE